MFECAHCRRSAAAVVNYSGNGCGATIADAERDAHYDAEWNAVRQVRAAACPYCGDLQPAVLGEYERLSRQAAYDARSKYRVSAKFALGVLVVAGMAAMIDVRNSFILLGTAFFAAV